MNKIKRPGIVGLVFAVSAGTAFAGNVGGDLSGYQEVPVISSGGSGSFSASIDEAAGEINWELSYAGTDGVVTQAHIHLGGSGSNGGVSAFLCTNLGNFPAQGCPASGTVSGTIRAADVIGPSNQGIAAGEFDELVRALEAGVAYINVHTTTFPGGELRGQAGKGKGNGKGKNKK